MKSGHRWIIVVVVIVTALAVIEASMGRLPLGPDGKFGWWEGDVHSRENSQRVADAYSFSHIIHGMAFYGLLWLVARRLRVTTRFAIAVAIEAGWELLENSPIIINRYREATIALGYVGDSILNSTSDLLMMSIGYFLAGKLPVRVTLAAVLIMEIGCAVWVRDNLTLNIIMLIHPIEAIKAWQSAG